MELKKLRKLTNSMIFGGFGIGFFFCLLESVVPDGMILFFGILGCAMVILGSMIRMFFWNCPHCDRHLPSRGRMDFKCCPYCGEKLDL